MTRNTPNRWMIAVLLAVLAGGLACGPSPEETAAVERQAEFDEVEKLKQELDAKRQQLAELEARAEAAVEEAADEAAEGAAEAAAALEQEAKALRDEVLAQSDAFGQRLVKFINDAQLVAGEQPSGNELAAIRMKSAEDMVLAREYIDKGGDYKRAIRIYQDALLVDPENPDLQAALDEAETLRFMSDERFAQIKNGMTQAEVRDALGQVNPRNRRIYEDRGVEAWFYPTAEGGKAAAVYFRKRGDRYTVYKFDFAAVDPSGASDEG